MVHHLRPLSTYSSPSRSIRSCTLVASELATSGSVIANPERISASSNGASQRSCCSGVPNWASTSMLPVSGALQLHASAAIALRPISSASGAYSTYDSPAPCSASGKNKFHNPRARASACNSPITGGSACGSPPSLSCASNTASAGYTHSSMNAARRPANSTERALGSKSIPRIITPRAADRAAGRGLAHRARFARRSMARPARD